MLNYILHNLDRYPLDGVVHFELEIDYPFIHNVIDYMETECKRAGIQFVRIKPRKTYAPTKSNNGFIVQEYILDLNDIGKNDEKKIRAQFDELFQRTNTADSYRLLAELSIEIGYFSPVCGIFFETMGDAVSYIKTKTDVDMTIVQSDKTNLEMIRTLDRFNLAMLLNHICADSKNRPSSTTGWYEWLGNNWNFMT